MKKSIYTIGFDKERPSTNNWDVNLESAKPLLDIVWTDCCTEEEAREKFLEFIQKQSHEYHELKTIKVWKVIRLYDETGRQIAQES